MVRANLVSDASCCRNRGNRKGQGGLDEPIEGLPELIAACNGKESVFSAMVARELHPSQAAQVRLQKRFMCKYESSRSAAGTMERCKHGSALCGPCTSHTAVSQRRARIPNYSSNVSANCSSNESVRARQQALQLHPIAASAAPTLTFTPAPRRPAVWRPL